MTVSIPRIGKEGTDDVINRVTSAYNVPKQRFRNRATMSEYVEFEGTWEQAESFLNANTELAKNWIMKHVPRKILEAWVAEKRLIVRGSEQQSISIRESAAGNLFEQAGTALASSLN